MSNSYRHTPIKSNALSDKEWKRTANRAWRRAVKRVLHWLLFWDGDPVMPALREMSNIYDAPSDDVKRYYGYLSKHEQDK